MYKCKICGKKFTELTALYNHIESKHKEMIPKDMCVQQYYYYMKTGKMNGNCVMCKQPTTWNQNTGKYNRFCGNPKCKDEYVKIMKGRMVAKYGKTHLLNDPDKQREMLAHRSISGVYTWSDSKHESTYTGSYELDFLKTLDGFFNWDPEDISMPSPHTYTYKYEGEDKFYIPDVFIHSLDLEIEIKDGGDNPNNHHKIQDVDKEKERLKDEVMCSQKAFHYIKITNKNYENFFRFLKEIKKEFEKYGDEKKIPRIFKIEDIKGTNVKPVKESLEIIEEGLISKLKDKLIKPKDPFNMSYKELKAKVDDAKKAYQKATTDGTFDMNEPNDVYRYSTILLNERNRVKNVIDVMENDKNCDGEKLWIMKHYHEWLQEFEDQIIHNMVNYIKKDIVESKSKLSKSFNNCKEPSQYREFITAVTYLIRYYRNLASLVNMPEVDAHCKWLESMHKKACDKADIGDGPLVFESNTEMWDDLEKGLKKFNKFTNVKYKERDAFLSLKYDLVKNDPKELQSYLSKLIKAARFEDDLWYVQQMAKKADDYYTKRLRKHPEMKDVYGLYYDWLKDGGIDKEIKARHKHGIKLISENYDIIEENLFVSKDNIEVNLDKFGSSNNILYITGLGGSGKSTIISKYAQEYNAEALEFDAITSALIKGLENLNRNKIHPIILEYLETQNPNKLNGFSDPAFNTESVKFLDWFENRVAGDGKLYILEGMQLFICFEPERFIDKPMIIMGTSVAKSMFRSVSRTYKRSEGDLIKTFKFFLKTLKRTPIFVKNDKQINELIDTVKESYIIDRMEESSISIPQMSYYLQNQYEEDMRDYLNTYKKYYNLMLKEQPAAVKHINEDIRQCLIVIDGLAAKGVENNLVQFAKDDLGEIVKASKKGKPVKVYESIANEVIDCKLVYNNPNSNQIFSLRDKDSKLIIENSYVIQRDKIGTSCSVTPYYKDIKEENILEFQLVINEGVNLTDLDNKAASGITIASLYNFNDKQNIFIREACMRLFGKYPDEIKFK